MVVSQKKGLHILHGAVDAAFPSGKLWVHAQFCASYPAADKMEGSLLVLFLGLSIAPHLPGNFFADAPEYSKGD